MGETMKVIYPLRPTYYYYQYQEERVIWSRCQCFGGERGTTVNGDGILDDAGGLPTMSSSSSAAVRRRKRNWFVVRLEIGA